MALGAESPSKSSASFNRRILLEVVTSAHSLDAALGINNTLLTRVEGVAVATNFYPKDRLGAACLENVAARASYR